MTRDYLEFMTSDLLMQFRGENCKNNRILLEAFARQLDDVLEVFKQIEERTYLRLLSEKETGDSLKQGAHGIHLDRIGEIVDLTRKQASFVSRKIESIENLDESAEVENQMLINFIKDKNNRFKVFYNGDVLSDYEYSEYLYYKIFLNCSYCTYSDVIKSLTMFWNNAPIYYEEKKEHPATLYLRTADLKPEQNARLFFLAPVVKSAGVGLFREAATVDVVRKPSMYVGGGLFNGVIQTELPYLIIEHKYEKNLAAPSRLENIISNIIPSADLFTTYRDGNSLYIAINKSEYNKYSTLVYPAMFNGEIVKGVVSPYYRKIDNSCGDCCVESVIIPKTAEVVGGFHRFRQLKSVEFSSALNKLLGSSFLGCNSLEVVVIPFDATITEIPSRCFECCVSLKEITIPETVTAIKNNAFTNCVNLKKIVFGGTQEQWESIRISSGNDCLNEADIEYLGGLAI